MGRSIALQTCWTPAVLAVLRERLCSPLALSNATFLPIRECVPHLPSLHGEALTVNVMTFGGEGSERSLRLNEIMSVGLL